MRRVAQESGAVAVLVAVLCTALFGMAAVVIDGGALRSERSQLQNGVDSAALALAKKCAYQIWIWCDAAATIADWHVDQTADDGTARIVDAEVDKTARTVRVVGGTEGEGKRTTMDLAFAGVLGHPTAAAEAKAVAGWNWRYQPWFLAVPVTRCEFEQATANGTAFGEDVVIAFGKDHTPTPDGCGDVPDNRWAGDGEVGYVGTTDVRCNPNSACAVGTVAEHLDDQEVAVSIWDERSNGTWELVGFAGFDIDSFARNPGQSTPEGGSCDKTHDCLAGRFTRTARVDGKPGGVKLGGEVWLIE